MALRTNCNIKAMDKHELRMYVDDAYDKASKIGLGNAYISWGEKDELIKTAKYYRKMILQGSYAMVKQLHCKDEISGELLWISIHNEATLREIILYLVADNFYMSRQQIYSFIKS